MVSDHFRPYVLHSRCSPIALLFILRPGDLTNTFSVSNAHISKGIDQAMDKAGDKMHSAPAGVSIRNGPVVEDPMDMDEPSTNGHGKRKSRSSISNAVKYKDDSEDSDAAPLVRTFFYDICAGLTQLRRNDRRLQNSRQK